MTTIQRALSTVLFLASGAAFAAGGVAFLSDTKGEVTLDGGSRAGVLAELAKGRTLVLGADSRASVMYVASGREFQLRGPGKFEVGEAELRSASGTPPVIRETEWRANPKVLVQVAQTSAASMRMRSIAQPKAPAAERLLFPTQGNVATLQPAFRWVPADAKGEFSLSVVGQEKPVHQAKAAASGYRVPAKLKPDTEYVWVVKTASGELGTGKFRTLNAEAIQRIEKRRPAEKAEFSDRLHFALLLQEAGATEEAQETWGRLAQERSDLPELAGLAR